MSLRDYSVLTDGSGRILDTSPMKTGKPALVFNPGKGWQVFEGMLGQITDSRRLEEATAKEIIENLGSVPRIPVGFYLLQDGLIAQVRDTIWDGAPWVMVYDPKVEYKELAHKFSEYEIICRIRKGRFLSSDMEEARELLIQAGQQEVTEEQGKKD